MSKSPVRRVLFVISCFRGASIGNGGHYYSMREMIAALGLDHQVLVIGDFFPEALAGLPNTLMAECAINSVRGPDFAAVAELRKPDLIHAYDLSSSCFAAILSWKWKVPFVSTKPGGPPYSKLTPFFDNMILFYQKDVDNVKSRPLPPKRVALIPNRVNLEIDAGKQTEDPFRDMPAAAVKLISIGRISAVYEEKIRQAIQLRAALAGRLGSASLCIIGKVEHEDSHQRLRDLAGPGPEIRFITDPAGTFQAARYLPFCDAAIGSGRGFMEAMGYGKPAFFSVRGTTLPCFADAATYVPAFDQNFSPRVVESAIVDPAAALERFVALQDDPAAQAAHRAWTETTFRNDHDIRTGAERTQAFYNSLDGHKSWLSARGAPARIWLNGVIKRSLGRRSVVADGQRPEPA